MPAPAATAETFAINQPPAEAEGEAASEAAAEPEGPGGAAPSSVTPAKAEAKPGKAGAKKGAKKGGKAYADLEAFVAVLLKVPAGSTITFQEVSWGPQPWAHILHATRAQLGVHAGVHPDQASI